MNPRDADLARAIEIIDRIAADPLYAPEPEPQYATIRDRPGITIPLLLAIVVVVAAVLALAVWGGTRP